MIVERGIVGTGVLLGVVLHASAWSQPGRGSPAVLQGEGRGHQGPIHCEASHRP
jgi:hypothetical protein